MNKEQSRFDLTEMVRSAVILADQLGARAAGVHLNGALVTLTGEGLNPPGWTVESSLDRHEPPSYVADADSTAGRNL